MTDDKTPAGSADRPAYKAREIGSEAMKAFAHPLRMAMYDYLSERGSATATMLAQVMSESTGQTSYHLRQLERHGFVEEDAERGTARERWWRPVGFSFRGLDLAKDPESMAPTMLLLQTQVTRRADSLRRWLDQAPREPQEWADASIENSTTIPMTAAELAVLNDAVMTVIHEHAERARQRHDAGRTDGERRVRIYLDSFPLPQD